MTKFISVMILALAVAGLVRAGGGLTDRELNARFYYDLGPDKIDVSRYPWLERQRYYLFEQTCSQCHTLARPISSPLTSRADWKRYVTRMHLRSIGRGQEGFFKEEGRHLIDFLAYDSRVRKIDQKAAFDAQTKELLAYFERISRERRRLQSEENKDKAGFRDQAPFTGVK